MNHWLVAAIALSVQEQVQSVRVDEDRNVPPYGQSALDLIGSPDDDLIDVEAAADDGGLYGKQVVTDPTVMSVDASFPSALLGESSMRSMPPQMLPPAPAPSPDACLGDDHGCGLHPGGVCYKAPGGIGGYVCSCKSTHVCVKNCDMEHEPKHCAVAHCPAPAEIRHAAYEGPCSEGSLLEHGGQCTARCAPGYAATVQKLRCEGGVLTPALFECKASPCAAPDGIVGAPQNGTCLEGESIPAGQVCTARCKPGHAPSVQQLRCHNGILSPSTFNCKPSMCAAPMNVTGASREGTCEEGHRIASGGLCTARCADGFTPSPRVLTCERGRLGPSTFVCKGSPCRAPLGVANAAPEGACAEGMHVAAGGLCTPQCAVGFAPSPGQPLQCRGGQLHPRTFRCKPNPCAVPEAITRVAPDGACGPNVTAIANGERCAAHCDEGYRPVPAALQCTDGQLVPREFECRAKSCHAHPDVDNAHPVSCVEGTDIVSGGYCTPNCMPGFVADPKERLTCHAGRFLPQMFRCKPIPCVAPVNIMRASSNGTCVEGDTIESGSQCTAHCAEGYAPTHRVLQCKSSVLLPSTFQCKPTPCVAPMNIPHAAKDGSCGPGIRQIVSGGYCESSCIAGYHPDYEHLRCAAGVLTPPAFRCIPDDCKVPLGILNAAPVGPCSGVAHALIPHKAICAAQCKAGYSPEPASLECREGQLHPPRFTCEANPCSAPEGVAHVSPMGPCAEGDYISDWHICTAACAAGYEAHPRQLACRSGELFPPSFECRPKNCIAPTNIMGMSLMGSCAEGSTIKHGSTCTARCKPGHEPSPRHLECQAGEFSPHLFECKALPCAAPLGLPHANSSGSCSEGSTIESGGICTAQCMRGYSPFPTALNCLEGKLAPAAFECQAEPCTAPTGVAHASSGGACMEGMTIQSGSSCTPQCEKGHLPSIGMLSCLAGGLSPPTFQCQAEPCSAPLHVANIVVGLASCKEGHSVESGDVCTPNCASGFTASVDELQCKSGQLHPPAFECVVNCRSESAISSLRGEHPCACGNKDNICGTGEWCAFPASCHPTCIRAPPCVSKDTQASLIGEHPCMCGAAACDEGEVCLSEGSTNRTIAKFKNMVDTCKQGTNEEITQMMRTLRRMGPRLEPYDCTDGLDSWLHSWSEPKQEWCCVHKNVGCKCALQGYRKHLSGLTEFCETRLTADAPVGTKKIDVLSNHCLDKGTFLSDVKITVGDESNKVSIAGSKLMPRGARLRPHGSLLEGFADSSAAASPSSGSWSIRDPLQRSYKAGEVVRVVYQHKDSTVATSAFVDETLMDGQGDEEDHRADAPQYDGS
eukprot:TRINITY_DN14443_c0_g1_i1.p1 TRINITY_DN14443_c0_g1~~TRINITY_DN14443_c0_g1_i1.p1  ORF type:complete len:1322 (-),score=183.34 TRINITY_DN14443_c0_g1_i1:179-4144(-)